MATAADSQGIMALPMEGAPPDTGAPAQPQLGLDDSYDAIQEGLQNASPDAHTAVNAELAKLAPQLDQLPDEVLDQLLQIVQYMHDNPKEYPQLLKDLVDEGIVEEGDFPEEYDPEFLATFGMVIMQARKTRQAAQQGAMPIQQAPVPPVGMARGGIAEAAHMVASRGRGEDTMLAHITPQEARMLRSNGGMGTINPATGLPEYGFFKNVVKAVGGAVSGAVKGVVGAVKTVLKSPIGKVLATAAIAYFAAPFLATMAPTLLASGSAALAGASMAVASGAVTALSGGGIKDVLKSAAVGGATAFFGAPGGVVSNFVGGAVTNAAANAAISSGIVGTGMGLLSGQKLQDAVKSGMTAGAVSGLTTGFSKGFTSQIEAPKVGTGPIDAQAADQQIKPVQTPTVQNQSDVNSSYTGKPSAGPAYDTGFGPGTNAFENSSYTGRTSNVGPTDIGLTPPPTFTGPVAPAPASSPSPSTDPRSFTGSLKDIGGGISDIAQGNFSTGFDQLGTGAKNLFLPSTPSPSEVMGSQEYSDLMGLRNPDGTPVYTGKEAIDMVTKSMSPGIFRTYAPGVAAGLGVMGLAGGYEQKQPEPTALQSDLEDRLQAEKDRVAANPGDYVPKGMERFGIQYNEKGEMIGSTPFNPQPAGPVNVAAKDYLADYVPPPMYNAPTNAVGGGASIYQPYNTASMYTNLMPPQYRADGGIASLAKGGYPRRTGQISGPGTETSDSIPAMLSDGEFVMTARAVRGAGKGNRLAGAKKMYALMHQLERNAARG